MRTTPSQASATLRGLGYPRRRLRVRQQRKPREVHLRHARGGQPGVPRPRLHRPRRPEHGHVGALRLAVDRHRGLSVEPTVGWRRSVHGNLVGYRSTRRRRESAWIFHGRLAARQWTSDQRDWMWEHRLEHVGGDKRSHRGLHRMPADPELSLAAADVAAASAALPAVAAAVSASATAHHRLVSVRVGPELHRRVHRQRVDLRCR